MVQLYSTDKYYDVTFNKLDYNIILYSISGFVDRIEVFKSGDKITESEEAKEVIEYFYDNLEAE